MKKLFKQNIMAAEDDTSPALDEAVDRLSQDFDYIVSGLEKLGRSGATGNQDALVVAEQLSSALQSAISLIADKVGQ